MAKATMTRKQRIAEFPHDYSISVTGRHVHVTAAMKAYAEEKLRKLERFGNRIIKITLTMDIQKLAHNVEIVMKYGHTQITSSASTTDMYVSIDQAIDKLEQQLKKYKGLQKRHHARDFPIAEVPEVDRPLSPEAYLSMSEVDEQEVNDSIDAQASSELNSWIHPHEIVKVETQPLHILSPEEAIMKMESTHARVMLFRDEVTRKLKVIYRQEDGNFGLIQPE